MLKWSFYVRDGSVMCFLLRVFHSQVGIILALEEALVAREDAFCKNIVKNAHDREYTRRRKRVEDVINFTAKVCDELGVPPPETPEGSVYSGSSSD